MMFMAFTMLLPAFFQAARVSALAVLAWALIFSLYALLLKFVLLRKALPMSEAAKSRGPGQGMLRSCQQYSAIKHGLITRTI